MTAITSPHNQHIKEVRKLQTRRGRARDGRFVAEGEDLLAAADAAGWPARERYCAAGSGLGGTEVEPAVLARRLARWARARERWRCTTSAGRRRPARSACTCTASATRATWARCCAARRRSASPRSCWAPTAPTPTARARCGPAWARVFEVAAGARPGRRPARRARGAGGPRGRGAARPGRGGASRCWWAPSARACRRRWCERCDRVAHIPVARGLAERRRGRLGGAV